MLAQFFQFLYSGMTVGSAYALAALGFTYSEAQRLRRIEMTLF